MTHGTAPRISLQVHLQHRRLRQVTTDEAALYPSLLALQSGPRLLGFLGFYGPVAQSGERRPRMAEVTSSSLVGSTIIFLRFAGKTYQGTERRYTCQPLLDDSLTTVEADLGEYVFHRTCSVIAHTGDHVRIGVQRDRHCGVAQKFLYVLGVYVTAQ